MKYLIISDFFSFFKKQKKINIIVFLIFFFYIFYLKVYIKDTFVFSYFMGFTFNFKYIALYSLYILNLIYYIYIGIYIYMNDIKRSYDLIFTRIKFKDWMIYKFISLNIILFLIKLIQIFFFILLFSYSLSQYDILSIIINYLILIITIIILIYIYYFKSKFVYCFMIIFIVINYIYFLNIVKNTNIYFIIIYLLLLPVIFYNFFNQKFIKSKIWLGGN